MSRHWTRRPIARTAATLAAAVALTLGVATPAVDAAGSAPTTSNPAPAPLFGGSFGHAGPGALSAPAAVAAGADSSVWVADRGTGRVEQFSARGRLLHEFGGRGVLREPGGLAVDSHGDIWVTDTAAGKVVEFAPSGARLAAFGSAGSGNGQLAQPQGLAVAPSGTVYVADQGNNRIEEFSATGGFLGTIAVDTPDGVVLDANGHIWVSSPSYADFNGIFEFSAAGATLLRVGYTQSSYGEFSDPAGIAAGPAGRLDIVQPDYGFVTVLNHNGSFYTEFGLQRNPRLATEDLSFPEGVAVSQDGTVWVADTGNGRIVTFVPASSGPAAALAPPAGPSPAGPRIPWPDLAVAVALLGPLAAARAAWRRRRRAVWPRAGGPVPTGPVPTGPLTAGPLTSRPDLSRRALLTSATALAGLTAGVGVLPFSLRKAAAASAASLPQGSISDIQHIVILMQENRSFDHYFGTMPGVRGFADPTAVTLPSGKPVFCQPDPSHAQGYLTPFHYDTTKTSAQSTPDTDHTWPTQHQAWASGAMDAWVAAKGPYTMGYFKQHDIQFHWALAETFTLCDNYHCSVLGPTNPNRLYMWTGMIDPSGTGGGPVIDDTPAYNNIILSWRTYPERLERAGISWRVYQEEDNYDDNALAWFRQYGYASRYSPLYQRGMLAQPAGTFENDAINDRLPQVSWLVAPTAQSEHPNYWPAAGAEYIAQKLDAIASCPDVWAKTAFILCYDENDGIFDHVVPPTAPAGTAGEFVDGLPIGLGFRTPTTIVSPWTCGGFVCSEVFDHSSLIRFIEARFGVGEPNISPWRRATCGDLTSAFRFAERSALFPRGSSVLRLAAAEAALLNAQLNVNNLPAPTVPATNEPVPGQ